jgi:3-phosphoshikimate 1-carboxyvinyltransferase
MLEKYTVNPSVNISGSICVPGDKSISHRSLILLSISNGIGVISGLLESDDCMATLKIFKMLGVTITKNINNTYTVHGKGLNGLKKTNNNLDCGNSGTSMRLLAGLLAGQKFNSSLVGDESLFKRPMERISSPLKMMGANITLSKNNTAPILIKPVKKISGIDYKMKIDSAQIKSSIILASLYSSEKTNIYENMPTRDHTENMINFLGGNIIKSDNIITINPKNKLVSKDIDIPGDISSAMFIIVGCLISKESEVLIKNVGLNKLRTGGIQILKMMGASIKIINKKTYGPEIVGDIVVKSSLLKGIDIPDKYIASAIDEFPILFIAAANASGKTLLKNAKELRFKESDRLLTMSNGLSECNIRNRLTEDGIEIEGGNFTGGTIDSYGDHRIAMSFAIAGLISKKPITILNTKNVSTSFPGFYNLIKDMGLNIKRGNV